MLIKTRFGDIEIEGGSINSDLSRETCPSCSQPDCCYQCDGSVMDLQSVSSKLEGCEEAEVAGRLQFNGAMDGIESVLLALTIKIQETRALDAFHFTEQELVAMLQEAVETAVEACGNNF